MSPPRLQRTTERPADESRHRDRAPSHTVVAARRFLRNPAGLIGLVGVTTLVVLALGADLFAPYDPLEQHARLGLQPPSAAFLFGTDELGRDLFSRVVFGGRISLTVGLISVLVGGTIGVGSGLISGYAGGRIDSLLMRAWDSLLAFPPILVGLLVATILGPSIVNAALAVGIYNIPVFARLTRASVQTERSKEYVEAARAVGARDTRIVRVHIWPNVLSPLIVQAVLAMAAAVLLEGALAFLGLGAQPPDPSWGGALARAQPFIRQAPWYAMFPGLALAALLVSLTFVADALRDTLDPRRANDYR